MKARVLGVFFAGKNGLRSAAVRSLTDDIAAVMGEAAEAEEGCNNRRVTDPAVQTLC